MTIEPSDGPARAGPILGAASAPGRWPAPRRGTDPSGQVNCTALHACPPELGNLPGAQATSMSLAGSTNTSITAGGSYGRRESACSTSDGWFSSVIVLPLGTSR